jgi:anti-anti-sigma factor
MQMTVENLEKDVTLVTLNGRLDVGGAAEIDLKFNTLAGARRAVIVDLSHVSFIASMGIRLLLTGARAVAGKRGKMALLAPIPDVASVLQTARIDAMIPICATRADAVVTVTG